MKHFQVILDKPGKKELVIPLLEQGEEVEVWGLVRGEEKGEYELDIKVDHRVGKTKGIVMMRGIAKNGARVKVSGLIKIDEKAQDVDDFLEMRVLILDSNSWAVVEPRLEIEANQVKASHAATVNKISEEEMFYLTCRGMDKEKAEQLIVRGFLKEITDKIKINV